MLKKQENCLFDYLKLYSSMFFHKIPMQFIYIDIDVDS